MTAMPRPGIAAGTTARSRPRRSVVARARAWVGGTFAPYLCIAPFFLLFFAFFAYPVGYSFFISLHRWAGIGPMRPVGLGNYTFVLTDDFWWGAVATTGTLWLMTIPTGTLISLLLAVLWNRKRARWVGVARVLYLLPAVSSVVAVAIVFRILFDQTYGPVNVVLGALHLPRIPWLVDELWSKPALAIVRLWESAGLGAIFFAAALQTISRDIYDAAAADGCGPVRQFRSITLPLLTGTILFVTVINTLAILSLFAEPQLITNDGGPGTSSTTVGLYLYHMLQGLDLGTASAVSFLMTGMMMLISIALFTLARRWQTPS